MTKPMAIVYRWCNQKLEFANRPEAQLPIAIRLGWRLLVKDSDLRVPDREHGEQQQD